MRFLRVCFLLCALPVFAEAQTYYVLVNPLVLRGSLGLARPVMEAIDDTLRREAYAVHLGIQGRFFSHIFKMNEKWVLTDGLYADLLLGPMTSKPLRVFNTEETNRFCFGLGAGYFAMFGYAGNTFGLLAGPRFHLQSLMIGETALPESGRQRSTCLQSRLEWRPAYSNEFRVQLSGWSNFNPSNLQQGFRLDIPINKGVPSFLFFEFTQMQTMGNYPHTFDAIPTRLHLINLGWRFGSIY